MRDVSVASRWAQRVSTSHRFIAVASWLLLAGMACGGPAPAGLPTAEEALVEAQRALGDAGSFRFTMAFSFVEQTALGPRAQEAQVTGAWVSADRFQVRSETMLGDDQQVAEYIVIGDMVFEQDSDGEWQESSGESILFALRLEKDSTPQSAIISSMRSETSIVTNATLDGVHVYRIVSEQKDQTVELYLDRTTSLLVKSVDTDSVATRTMTWEFYDYGADIQLDVPAGG